MAAVRHKPRHIIASLNYRANPPDGKPEEPIYMGVSKQPDIQPVVIEAKITDIRGREDQYTLSSHAFQIVKHSSSLGNVDFEDDEKIKTVYYPEIEALIKEATGASRVHVFQHVIRRKPLDFLDANAQSDTDSKAIPANKRSLNRKARGPLFFVHVDESYDYAPELVRLHLPDEAECLLKSRFQIINAWRPIKTVLRGPLALCLADSVPDSDLVPLTYIYPQENNRKAETFLVLPPDESKTDGGHRWHYLFKQTSDEVTLIKCFDSVVDGIARRAPHTAFLDNEFVKEDPREIIQINALVF